MRTLILGGGGREHALARSLSRGGRASRLYCAQGNPGVAKLAKLVDIRLSPPWDEMVAFCRRERIDLVVPGPEAPLALGVADALAREGIACFGPSAAAARIESSKSFARELAREAGIPSPEWIAFDDVDAATKHYLALERPWWIKADGLAAGKGSALPPSHEIGANVLRYWMRDGLLGEGGRRVVLEEPLKGVEVSAIGLATGDSFHPLAASHDYKRLLDGDLGPNTGGMGAVAPTPRLAPGMETELIASIIRPALRALLDRGIEYRGFLYAGIILTSEGPRLLEFNCRLGDPEAQAILPLVEGDLAGLLEDALAGRRADSPIARKPGARVAVVGATEGYPEYPRLDDAIDGIDEAEAMLGDRGEVYVAGTRRDGAGALRTSGGRVLSVSAGGATLREATALAYAAMDRIAWRGMRVRRDVGERLDG